MSEKRFALRVSSFSGEHMKFVNIEDNGKRLNSEEIVELLNEQQATISALKKQLDYLQNSISNAIQHQKTELGQKALKEIISNYNEWLLGHKELEE